MLRVCQPVGVLLLGGLLMAVAVGATAQEPPPTSQPAAESKTDAPDPKTDPTPAKTETKPADPKPRRGSAKASAEDVLKAFQKDRPTRVPIAPSSGTDVRPDGAGTSASGTSRRLPDGSFVVDRAGRITREGEWYVFSFEGYSESQPELPMRLLPNQLLELAVRESDTSASPVVFIVTGEVTEFMGENYLLLRKTLRRRNLGNLER